jgi:hypothetical protein
MGSDWEAHWASLGCTTEIIEITEKSWSKKEAHSTSSPPNQEQSDRPPAGGLLQNEAWTIGRLGNKWTLLPGKMRMEFLRRTKN